METLRRDREGKGGGQKEKEDWEKREQKEKTPRVECTWKKFFSQVRVPSHYFCVTLSLVLLFPFVFSKTSHTHHSFSLFLSVQGFGIDNLTFSPPMTCHPGDRLSWLWCRIHEVTQIPRVSKSNPCCTYLSLLIRDHAYMIFALTLGD
jgi:hypothetical protein